MRVEYERSTLSLKTYVNDKLVNVSVTSGGFASNPRLAIHIASTGYEDNQGQLYIAGDTNYNTVIVDPVRVYSR